MKVTEESLIGPTSVGVFLKKGGIVICPTDTVYGFLADASNKKAVDKIFRMKQRPKTKPLSLFVKSITAAKEIAQVDKKQLAQLKKYWPGKYTFILNRKPSAILFGVKKDTIGIRIPKHPFLSKVLKAVDRPLAQTSVNISDNPPLNDINDIINQFGKFDILIINGGDIKNAKASNVIDLSIGKLTKLR